MNSEVGRPILTTLRSDAVKSYQRVSALEYGLARALYQSGETYPAKMHQELASFYAKKARNNK